MDGWREGGRDGGRDKMFDCSLSLNKVDNEPMVHWVLNETYETGGWVDGCVDGRTDGRADRCTYYYYYY